MSDHSLTLINNMNQQTKHKKNQKQEKKEIVNDINIETLTTDEIFKVPDLFFKKRFAMFRHQYDSFNKFIDDDIRNFLLKGDNTFFEKTTKDSIIKYALEFDKISIRPAILDVDGEMMFPSDARSRGLTYAAKIIAKVTQTQEITNITTGKVDKKIIGHPEENVPIASIPILLRSKYCSLNIKKNYDKLECDYDPGCYFIVNGSEKVVISQERLCENKPLVLKKKDTSSEMFVVQVNSRSAKINGMIQVITIQLRKGNIMLMRAPILNEFPAIILFKALGVTSEKQIVNYIVYDQTDTDMLNLLKIIINKSEVEKGKEIETQAQAINYLSNKIRINLRLTEGDKEVKQQQKKMYLENLLDNNFLPHIEGGRIAKAYFIGYMINKLLNCVLGRAPSDDRDSHLNKRIDLVGNLVDDLFRQHFKKMMSDCNKYFKRKNPNDENPINIINIIKPNTIEQGLKGALLTGKWGNKKTGVAQILSRESYLQAITMFRRIDSPSGSASTSKITGPRHTHQTQVGNICAVETPEHTTKVGLVKHLTIIGSVTIALNSQIPLIKDYLKKKQDVINLDDVQPTDIKNYSKVFLNGEWLCITNQPLKLCKELKKMKYGGSIDMTTSITYDDLMDEVKIYCDGGRLYRPMLRVKNNKLLLTKQHINLIDIDSVVKNDTRIIAWDEFMIKHPGIIEYIDSDEEALAMIARTITDVEHMRSKMIKSIELIKENPNQIDLLNRYGELTFVRYTHCEIHPSLLLGIIATNIPFCSHNQGPRNTYQFAQGKQAMCIYNSSYRYRLDGSHILYHPAIPLVNTRTSKYMNNDVLSPGENCVVALASYTGFNQDDSIVFNSASIDRGLFRSSSFKKFDSTIQKNQYTSKDDVFTKPDPSRVMGMRNGSYDKLNDKGFVPEETIIYDNDIIIGKVSPIPPTGKNGKIFKDNSVSYKSQVPGIIDKVYTDIYNFDGYEMRKVRVRSERIPNIGDKFCVTSDAEVLTSDGWIQINKVTKKHKVASLINNKYLEYVHPIDTYEFDYDGDMYKLRSQQVDLDVTMDHRMYVKLKEKNNYESIKTKKIIGKAVQYKKWAENHNPDIKNFTKIKGNTIDMNVWLKFFGIWMAEGWANVYNEDDLTKVCYQTTIMQCKPRIKDILENIVKDMKYTTYCVHDNKQKFTISNKPLCDYMKTLSVGAVNKSLPNWVWKLSQSQSQILLEHMILGDGHKCSNTSACYYTSSKKLADDVMRLAIHCGWSANVSTDRKAGYTCKIRGKTITSTNDSLCIHINKSNMSCLEPKINYNPKTKGRYESTYHYKGKVYCLEVPSHVFMIRQKGKVVLSCNCSRHGQKGTIGIILSSADMPFTERGLSPDLIINPCCIPSRMTIAQLIECILGKVGALEGYECDGTSFTNPDVIKIGDLLEKLGYQRNGTEYLYNGMTGQKMPSQIFIGPTFYQRLKHLVMNKVHSRARGPRQLLTRQPPEGRSRDGGLRIGEMERDAIIAHGMSKYLKEKLMDTSDPYTTFVCNNCGLFAQRMPRSDNKDYGTETDIYWCQVCGNKTNISQVRIPYAFKLLIQEMMSMCIVPRLRFEENKYNS